MLLEAWKYKNEVTNGESFEVLIGNMVTLITIQISQ